MGVQGAGPLAGVARGQRPLASKKILYFVSSLLSRLSILFVKNIVLAPS